MKNSPKPLSPALSDEVTITHDSKPLNKTELKGPSLRLNIHHMTLAKYSLYNHILNFDAPGLKNLHTLKLVIYDCDLEKKQLIKDLNFSPIKNLKTLKLNFGCLNLDAETLKGLKGNLKCLDKLETFHLSLPNAGLSEEDIKIIDDNFINFTNVKDLGFNFIKILNVKKEEKIKLNLDSLAKIIEKCAPKLNKLSLNLSQNELDNVEPLQEALMRLCDRNISLKLILFNCSLKQRMILMICDTLLKFDNLESVKLDIRENFKKDYPSCKVISYCETLICAFRHMLAEGNDDEVNRKYKVSY